MRLRGRRVGFGLLVFVDLVALFYSGDAVYLWILVFLGALLLVGYLQALTTLRSFSLKLTLPEGRVMSGEQAEIELTARIDLLLPPAHLTVDFMTADPRESSVQVYASPIPGRPAVSTVVFDCPYRGEYEIGVRAVEAVDLLGLIRLKRSGDELKGVTSLLAVYPRTYPLSDRMLDLRMNEGAEDGARTDAEEVSSVADLRDWRDGDSLKRVHWKLSARAEKLIVKEFDGSFDAKNMIFFDATRSCDLDTAERMTSCAASFAELFCGQGRRVQLISYGDARTETDGVDGGFASLHLALARVKFGGELEAAKALELECTTHGSPDSLVLVTSDLDGALVETLSALGSRGARVTVAACCDLSSGALATARDELRRHGVRLFVAPEIADLETDGGDDE